MSSRSDAHQIASTTRVTETTAAFTEPSRPGFGPNHPANVFRSPLAPDRRKIAWYLRGAVEVPVQTNDDGASSEFAIACNPQGPDILLGLGAVDASGELIALNRAADRATLTVARDGADVMVIEDFEDRVALALVAALGSDGDSNPSRSPFLYAKGYNAGFPLTAPALAGASLRHKFYGVSIARVFAYVAYISPVQRAAIGLARTCETPLPANLREALFATDVIRVSPDFDKPHGGVIGVAFQTSSGRPGGSCSIAVRTASGDTAAVANNLPIALVPPVADAPGWRAWWCEHRQCLISEASRVWPPPAIGSNITPTPIPTTAADTTVNQNIGAFVVTMVGTAASAAPLSSSSPSDPPLLEDTNIGSGGGIEARIVRNRAITIPRM